MNSSNNGPVHVAITRHVKPGCEEEFQNALRDFLSGSFSQSGVHGANMILPAPGSKSGEFGILRTFASEQECDAFYESPIFKAWDERVRPLTEGLPVHRHLTGLEAWFRSPQDPPPPQWKMAFLTFLGVWPVSMAVPAVLTPLMGKSVPNVIFAGAVALGIVIVLTWIVMPILVKIFRPWLYPKTK